MPPGPLRCEGLAWIALGRWFAERLSRCSGLSAIADHLRQCLRRLVLHVPLQMAGQVWTANAFGQLLLHFGG